MASAETPEEIIGRFASALEQAGVPYMLTGSFASGFHGAPRATHDIDFVIAPTLESLNRLVAAFPQDAYYVSRDAALDAFRRQLMFNVVDFASGWKVDFICRKSRAYSVTEFERRTEQELGGQTIYVASSEDVVLSKLEWAKASGSERQLRDVAGVVQLQGDRLDSAYLDEWVESLALQSQWELVQEMMKAEE